MSIKEITSGNGGFVILPSIKHTATFILLHGLGDSAKGIGSLARQMSVKFPYIKFIVPTAPNRPLTMRGGARMNAWYDLATINDDEPDPCTGAKESADYIVKLIEDEIAAGIPSNRIILSGFSQGGIMSLFIGLSTSLNLPLGGLLIFSSYLRKALPFNFNPALQNTPILHNHGLDDPVVRFEWAQRTKDFLTSKGVSNYQLKSYARLGHSLSQEVVENAELFVQQHLPPLSSEEL